MARKKAQSGAPASGSEPVADLETKAGAEAFAEAVADELVGEEEVTVEDLDGSPRLLDMLDELPVLVREKHGFSFEVFVTDRGPEAYLPDSRWGSRPPTRQAVAERYGPGSYRVIVKTRRRGRGGGFGRPIDFTIAPPRSPHAPALSPHSNESRAWDLLERLLGQKEKADAARLEVEVERAGELGAGDSQLAALSSKLEQVLEQKSTAGIEIPEFLKPVIEKFLSKLIDGGDAPKGE